MKATAGAAVLAATLVFGTAAGAQTVTIATVNNSDMIIMQELSSRFEEKTGIDLEWVVLEENVLRQRVTTDIATGGGQFDIITIGSYEAPIWGKRDWLTPLDDLGPDYDYADIFKGVRDGLSHDGTLYALPFYAESSFTFYRTDLFEEAGLTMPDQPTWEQVAGFAKKLHDPDNDQYGICLRGKPGWGENMAFVSTLANTFGGRWFDMDWEPQLESEAWQEAISFYVDLLGNYGPPGASSNGHNENRALFASGNCAMWVDATSAAGYIFNPSESRVADSTGFAPAPIAETPKGANWFWSWALGIPASSKEKDAAKDFIAWATSKDYVKLVGENQGWVSAPPGTRQSTYALDAYKEAAPFADFVLRAIKNTDPADPTKPSVPYSGIQYVSIPEFQGIGTQVGQQIAAALAGNKTVAEALDAANNAVRRTMRQAGYIQ